MRSSLLKFSPALLLLALMPLWSQVNGQGSSTCPRTPDQFARIQQDAQGNDPKAQTILASCYELGRNVEPNGKEAIRWLTRAAGLGYAPAEYELGRTYLYGRGIPADYKLALLWEKKAAEQGEREAQRDLAFMYERGFGVEQNATEAARWNRKAAEQGEPAAQLHLAESMESSPQNGPETIEWYLKAARQNRIEAQLRLAQMYAQGRGTPQNYPAAVQWYRKAAEGGETQAMYELGKLYLGDHGARNVEAAFFWFQIGARFGSPESQAEAAALESTLTRPQRLRAASSVERWLSKHSGAQKEEEKEEKEER